MDADTVVYVVAAALIAVAQAVILLTVRPRPSGLAEVLYLVAPAAGVVALLVAAWMSI